MRSRQQIEDDLAAAVATRESGALQGWTASATVLLLLDLRDQQAQIIALLTELNRRSPYQMFRELPRCGVERCEIPVPHEHKAFT